MNTKEQKKNILIYIITTKPDNTLSISTICQLAVAATKTTKTITTKQQQSQQQSQNDQEKEKGNQNDDNNDNKEQKLLVQCLFYILCPPSPSRSLQEQEEMIKIAVEKEIQKYYYDTLQYNRHQDDNYDNVDVGIQIQNSSSNNNNNDNTTTATNDLIIRVRQFDPFLPNVYSSATVFVQELQHDLQKMSSLSLSLSSAGDGSTNSSSSTKICGIHVLFNPHGAIGEEKITTIMNESNENDVNNNNDMNNNKERNDSSLLLLPIVEYKLISSAILLDQLIPVLSTLSSSLSLSLSSSLVSTNTTTITTTTTIPHVIFTGSESARGLPKMGFPVPNLGTTEESITSFLTGTAYFPSSTTTNDNNNNVNNNNDNDNLSNGQSAPSAPTISTTASSTTTYTWEAAYANTCAIAVLYMKALARRYPIQKVANDDETNTTTTTTTTTTTPTGIYFGTISPGMTPESFNPYHTYANPSWLWIIQMFIFKYIMFNFLKKHEIAKDVKDGAALFVKALLANVSSNSSTSTTTTTKTTTNDSNSTTNMTKNDNPKHDHNNSNNTNDLVDTTATTTTKDNNNDGNTNNKNDSNNHNNKDNDDDEYSYYYPYPSGTFVGARGGTGGPICDQTELDGGKVFLNQELQDIAYRVVQKYIDIAKKVALPTTTSSTTTTGTPPPPPPPPTTTTTTTNVADK